MMTAPALAVWIAAALFVAGLAGWLLRGAWAWLCMSTGGERARIAELADAAHTAEEAREAAEAARAEAEARLAEAEAALTAERAGAERGRAETEARLTGALAETETRLAAALREAETEAETAWEGLAAARRRIGELERELEALRRGETA